jgi:hypothetical protein
MLNVHTMKPLEAKRKTLFSKIMKPVAVAVSTIFRLSTTLCFKGIKIGTDTIKMRTDAILRSPPAYHYSGLCLTNHFVNDGILDTLKDGRVFRDLLAEYCKPSHHKIREMKSVHSMHKQTM